MQQLIARAPILIAVVLVGIIAQQATQRLTPTWDPAVEPYVAFVEQTRQLEFTEPVAVVRANVAMALGEADDLVQSADPVSNLGYDPHGEALRLLGLTGPIGDMRAAEDDVREAGAAAFYDPNTKTIVLPEGQIDPLLELTIVHELTHALQDQHGLLVYNEVESWSSAAFRTSLIEGDASLVEHAWYDSLSVAGQLAIDDLAFDGEAPAGFLHAGFASPYVLGPPVVSSVVADGGYEALNRMLRLKSLGSDERLLDPMSPSGVPKFDAEFEMVDPDGNEWFDGWIGAFGWYHAIAPSAGAETALQAIQGYDNDVFVAFERDGQVCARFDVWFDTRNDAAEFTQAIVGWGVVSNIINPNRTTVRLDLCEPVGDPAAQVGELLTPLVVHNWLVVNHQAATDSRAVIRCAATAQAAAHGFTDGRAIDWAQLAAQAPAARAACGEG